MRLEDEASARSAFLASRPISQDNLVPEDPTLGLVAFSSPFDPEASLRIEDGRIVELDGTLEADFDLLDEFIARRGIDVSVAEEAMAVSTLDSTRAPAVESSISTDSTSPSSRPGAGTSRNDGESTPSNRTAVTTGRVMPCPDSTVASNCPHVSRPESATYASPLMVRAEPTIA